MYTTANHWILNVSRQYCPSLQTVSVYLRTVPAKLLINSVKGRGRKYLIGGSILLFSWKY